MSNVRKFINWLIYFIAVITIWCSVWLSLDRTASTYIILIILSIGFLILPILHLIDFLKTYYYSKFVKTFLSIDREHYLMLAKHDDSFKALLLKMEEIVNYK